MSLLVMPSLLEQLKGPEAREWELEELTQAGGVSPWLGGGGQLWHRLLGSAPPAGFQRCSRESAPGIPSCLQSPPTCPNCL